VSQTKAELIKGLNINASAPATALNIDSSGRVGIGTTSPGAQLHSSANVSDGTVYELLRVGGTHSGASGGGWKIAFNQTGDGAPEKAFLRTIYNGSWQTDLHTTTTAALTFGTNSTERARIDSSGRLLVGTSTSDSQRTTKVQIAGAGDLSGWGSSFNLSEFGTSYNPWIVLQRSRNGTVGSHTVVSNGDILGGIQFNGSDGDSFETAAWIKAEVDGTPGNGDMPGRLVFSTTADGASSPTQRMRIANSGYVFVGDAVSQGYGPSLGYMMGIRSPATAADQTYLSIAAPGQTLDTQGMILGIGASAANLLVRDNKPLSFATNDVTRMTIAAGGSVSVVGALSKGSGSFRIDHPLSEKKDTHQLVHSFIEGPQADLIYRGHVCLVNGKAQINIDEVAQMTEGTFEALCRDVCCFTTNESDWTPVRGSVTGNILTIEAQDPASCADVCWLVIGERKDQHMLDTDWTDENGKVITEPLKETSIPETA
jgi:hypothetical protein